MGPTCGFALDPATGRQGDHRDEPAGVAIVGAGVQGDRVRSPRSPPSSPWGTRSMRSRTTSPERRPPASSHRSTTWLPRCAGRSRNSGTTGVLGTQMQSVGEVMAIGRTFAESLQKALRSLEQGRLGLNADPAEQQLAGQSTAELLAALGADAERIFQIAEVLHRGVTVEQVRGVPHRRVVPRPDHPDRRAPGAARRGRRRGRDGPPDVATHETTRVQRRPARPSGAPRPAPSTRRAGARASADVTCKTVDTCAAEFAPRPVLPRRGRTRTRFGRQTAPVS